MRKIEVAVVGLGHWGPKLLRNVRDGADFTLAAVCDVDPSRRTGDAPFFEDVGEMLRVAKPELVCVATPVSAHHAVAKAALEAGAHVYCEKPLAANVREAEELVALAGARGLRLFVNQMCAAGPSLRRIREGALGTLVHVEAERLADGRVQPDVDVVWDLAPHDLAILRYVLGGMRVASVETTGRREDAELRLAFAGGATATMRFSWVSPAKVRRMRFIGTTSSIVHEDHEPNALARELTEVARALRGEPAHVGTAEEALETVRVLEASRASLANDGARTPVS